MVARKGKNFNSSEKASIQMMSRDHEDNLFACKSLVQGKE